MGIPKALEPTGVILVDKPAGPSSFAALADANARVYEDLDALDGAAGGQLSPAGAYWEAVRRHYVFDDGRSMMNNGTMGPVPAPVFNTTVEYLRMQMTAPCDCYL